MKTLITILLTFVLVSPIYAQYEFKDNIKLKCQAVTNQQRTGTCWSFATSSFLEAELLRQGMDIDLSEMYFVRKNYELKAQNYVLRQGKAQFSEGSLAHDVIHILNTYGLMPQSAFDGHPEGSDYYNHGELESALKGFLNGVIENGKPSPYWQQAYSCILDAYIDPIMEFEYDGNKYNPLTFAASLPLQADDYISLTSFTHHPFQSQFVLEIPDNYSNGSYYNVTLEELLDATDEALKKGYTISWDGDVSEKSFSQKEGLAIMPVEPSDKMFEAPVKELSATQEIRQQLFENYKSTDDHLMHVIGTATDQNGTKYYIIKNSWGEAGPYKGLLYMSESYYALKTIAITVNKNSISKKYLSSAE